MPIYCIYIDELVEILRVTKVGCFIKDIFLSVLLYADDVALLSPSLKGLQTLLCTCEIYCIDWDICFNAGKSKNMHFGKNTSNLATLYLNGGKLEWVGRWKYLGVTLPSHKSFNCRIEDKE